MTEQERAAALADAMFRQFIDERGASNVECVFDPFSFEILIKALRLLSATPAASPVVTDEMEAAAAIAVRAVRNPYITPETEGTDYDRKVARAAIEAALKKEPER